MNDPMRCVAQYIWRAKWAHWRVRAEVIGSGLEIIPVCGPMSLVKKELLRLAVDYTDVGTTRIDLGSVSG